MLQEELSRLKEAEKSYLGEIKKLPKGSIQQKKIKGIPYLYLSFREGPKVVSRYLGNLSEAELKNLKEGISLRRRYKALLREVRKNKKQIEKMVRGKARTAV